MSMNRRALARLIASFAIAATAAATIPTMAQDFPSRPIELTLGFGPGSGLDANARLLAPYLQKALGQPVTIINQPGGGAVPWANGLARATADGYTIGMVGFPLLQNNSVLSQVEYDPETDFTYLGVLTTDPAVIVVGANSPYHTVQDLIDAARSGTRVSIGSTGRGSVDYLVALSIQRAAGDVEFGIVNFDSSNEGIVAAMGGSLSAMPLTASSAQAYIQSGQMRALAAGSETPIDGFNAPSFTEAGIDLLIEGSSRAFLAPANLPEEVKQKLGDAIKAAIDEPDFRRQAATAGLAIVYKTPDETAELSARLLEAGRTNLQ